MMLKIDFRCFFKNRVKYLSYLGIEFFGLVCFDAWELLGLDVFFFLFL